MASTFIGSAAGRSVFGRAARGMLILPLALFCLMAVAAPPLTAVRISEIATAAGGPAGIELLNTESSPVSLNGAVLVVDNQTVTLSGLADMAPGGTVVVHWNREGLSSGSEFFTGKLPPLDPAAGTAALFKSARIDD